MRIEASSAMQLQDEIPLDERSIVCSEGCEKRLTEREPEALLDKMRCWRQGRQERRGTTSLMWSEVADKARVYDKQTDKSLQSTSKKTQEEETALEGCG